MDQKKTTNETVNFVISQELVMALLAYIGKQPIVDALGLFQSLRHLPRVRGLISEEEMNSKKLKAVETFHEE